MVKRCVKGQFFRETGNQIRATNYRRMSNPDFACSMNHEQATRRVTDGRHFLKRVGERIAKQCLALTRLEHKLNAPAAAAWSFGILAILSSIYAFSPVAASGDSRWSLHTAMSLIRGHAGDLTEYMPALERNDFYAIEYVNGRPHTSFPIGVSILAIPAVAIGF
jgi:hypothetical protein